uniref:Tryptophan-rich sensory-like protein n=1 Tax=Tetraselmis sp. GSL018 TaxID=582737 RepID=A0A061SDE3_9CHLO
MLHRTIASTIVWDASGRDLTVAPIAWFLLHLCIGDTWNTINNIDRRLGTSAIVVLFVLASAANAVIQYYKVAPMAGYVLAPLVGWLVIATLLVWNIWAINGKQAFIPTKHTYSD